MRSIFVTGLFLTILTACSTTNDKTNIQSRNSNEIKVYSSNSNLVPYKANINSKIANGSQNANVKIVNRDTANNKTKFEERSAPYDSVFESRLDANGAVETRTFKNHPQLLKIERTTLGKDSNLKVYLKNGKVYDVSEEKVPNFRVNSPQIILKAIGLETKSLEKKITADQKMQGVKNEKQ